MAEGKEGTRALLKKYADALDENAKATTDEEQDKTADDLVEITGALEERGQQAAQLIYELLGL